MDTIEGKRIEATNYERYQLATSHGWQFWADVPDLLTRWQVLPFNQRGDKRLAFGVIQGNYQGMQFTVFDFHRRPTVTSVHTRWTNKKVNELDSITIDSVWVITLPVAMPPFQIVSDIESTFDTDQYPEPPTADRKFNRWYKMIDTDPNIAVQVLTPPVMSAMRQLKLHNWSLVGNELIYVEHPTFGRTKPDDIVETLGKLTSLVGALPMHQPPQQQMPPPMVQPPAQHPQYQQAYPPQQHYPPQQYPQQPPQQPPYGYPPRY